MPSTLRTIIDDAHLATVTVDQYARMIASGIIPEGAPIELLDGLLVRKDRARKGDDIMSIGEDHARAVNLAHEALLAVRALGCFVQVQQPIRIAPENAPEPDITVVAGQAGDYRRFPGPADVVCVVEVADSSLEHDRTTKLAVYAEAGIPQYIIVNLVDATAIEYRQPRRSTREYAQEQIRRAGEVLTISAPGGACDVKVADLLA
jgi:hypothetical protein